MSKTRAVSFRLPSKYVVFMDALAADYQIDRSKVLVRLLDGYLQQYLSQKNQHPAPDGSLQARANARAATKPKFSI